ncbi:MAG TPA: DUF6457 domain-containing protein [Acidimicrobiia bacterium]|nr:DUF6457 domain-containing protein [Acidimicrobiia bacterium]
MLERWLRAAVEEAGGGGVDDSLLSSAAVTLILDVARHAAHEVERPAAPLAAFAAGLALGRSGGGLTELEEVAARLGARARSFGEENDEGQA